MFLENSLSLAQGDKLTIKYRLFIHDGEADKHLIEALYEKYVKESNGK